MQSFVVGATGIVGGYIVEHLVRSGETPLALSRSQHRGSGAVWLQGDLAKPETLKPPSFEILYCTVDIALLADALPHIYTPALKRVIAFTSTGIVTKIESEVASERELLQRLAEGERRLISACERYRIGCTILRPTIIYAEGRDGNISRLAGIIQRFGVLPLMGTGGGLRQPVHAEDLAIGAIAAAASEAAIGKTYAMPGGETISYREMVGRIFDALGKPRRIISTPPLVWRLAFALAKPLFPNANAAMGARMAKDMVFDRAPALRDFGWNPRGFHPRFELQDECRNRRVLDLRRGGADNCERVNQEPSQLRSSSPKIVILLATRNGAAFVQEQLDSYQTQTYGNWELLVSDDGSTDDTIKIIEQFAKQVPQRVVVRRGPEMGFWQNFVSLIRSDDLDGDLFAYSDQDDIWFPEKLAKAVSWFEARPTDQPGLYFTRTELIEAGGTPIGFSPLFVRAPTFQNALVQNIGGGNTMVFNRAARLALRATPADVALVSHDWWTYQVVTGIGGTAHYDPWPSLRYRQHKLNLIGANKGLRARLVRLSAFAAGRMVMWNDVNLTVLGRIRNLLTPRNALVLDHYARIRQAAWPMRLWLLWKSGVYRQSFIDNFGLFLGALFGRL
jgi:nucleoside-diphosphate-sugar epimerase/glycosyltransferase involved in cell wall biosynthesis